MAIIARMKARMGEFWWGTALMFVACRFGDAVNAVISIWLVPKFVNADDLGAVLPLANFAGFLVFPVSVFTVAYTRKVAELGAQGRVGQLKTLIRGVFIGAGLFFTVSLVVSFFAMPMFLERIHVGNGVLGFIVLAGAFAAAVAPVFSAALQALGKFGALSLLQVVTAPARLLTMAGIMPSRPLIGYFVGQSASPLTSIGVALWALRRELRVKAEPFWREHRGDFLRLMAVLAAIYAVGSASGTLQSTLLRTRMPSVDSAAYYLITRFAEVATYAGSAMAIVLFPIAAQAKAKGTDATLTIYKANLVTFLSGAVVAIALYAAGEWLFGMIETCRPYTGYYPEMALAALSMTMGMAVCNFANYEIAQNRFGYFLWEGPLSLATLGFLHFAGFSTLRGFILTLLAQNLIGFIIVTAVIRFRIVRASARTAAVLI